MSGSTTLIVNIVREMQGLIQTMKFLEEYGRPEFEKLQPQLKARLTELEGGLEAMPALRLSMDWGFNQ